MTADTTPRPTPAHLRTGDRGEDLAARYLERHGLVVLARNWRCPEGELDLIATDRERLIVCEVKTRTSTNYGHPTEAVTDEKANRIRRLSRRWRTTHNVGWCNERFDIISIIWPPGEPPRIQHFKGAF
ncbi:YraN family protein [Actinophytocola sp.]|jgi:putative endonuclease|uniref:YraN family protein n=1 Tax=Actinophytocola sp. TaxID=1872138 RepID=UPI002ED79BFE